MYRGFPEINMKDFNNSLSFSSQAVTQVTLGRWFYLMITWKPTAGLNIYINENKKASTVNPLIANNPPINDQNPNLAVGRGLGSAGGTCGTFYMSSLAIFKQYVDANMVKRIYRFFWVNSKYTS